MKLHILSDLHIEFSDLTIPDVASDLIILPGDVHIGTKGLDWIKHNFKDKEIVYVLGNHEYYYSLIPKLCNDLIKKTKGSNIHILENEELIIGDVVFLGCTLWTNFELYGDAYSAADHAKNWMNDYRIVRIMPDYKTLCPGDTINFYNKSFNWLDKKIKKYKDKKIVVITHSAPSIKSCLIKYKEDLLTAAFASDLEEFIKNSNINTWIHGHTHNSANYMIGNTRVICNPRGYNRGFGNNENSEFDVDLVIDI